VGSTTDPQFGPVLLFGFGGQLVEVFRDRALALPPLNATLARRMIEQTKICAALKGVRGRPPVNLSLLEQVLVRFSQLVLEQPWIREIDVNPLLVAPSGVLALDARVVLHGRDMKKEQLPRSAIRPYPTQYVSPWQLNDGTNVLVRPIRPEDEPQILDLHRRLSERSVRMRYFHPLQLDQRTAHERLSRVCFNDYDRELALIVERRSGQPATQILAVARLSKVPGQRCAEFALVIDDDWQQRGLGAELLKRLIQIGRDEKVSAITGDILAENRPMQRICERLGFQLERGHDDDVVKAVLVLDGRELSTSC
jgi:acetyltransferase